MVRAAVSRKWNMLYSPANTPKTMAVIMVAGNVAQMPKLLEPVRFLTTAIVTEMAYASEETSGVLMGIGLVLFVFIVVINGLFYALIKRTAAGKR